MQKQAQGDEMAENPGTMPRTALVTGGARRIGEAVVRDLAAHGYAIAVHVNSATERAERIVDEIRAAGGAATVVSADLTIEASPARLFDAARQAIGPIGLLVNNASIFERDTAEAPDMALWEKHFAVHLKAPALLGAALHAQTDLGDGLIVNIIDQRVWKLTPDFFSYTLSKSALWTATRTMAQAFAPKTRVNAIGPGPTLANERQSAADFAMQIDGLPLKRGPGLDEFGRTIRYLAETKSITGQMIALDGGQHLAWQTPDVTGMAE
jgi:NAD(P)-dependent dehydrogenase (short-subunit alcohol dehydrogenase family)